VKQDLGKLLLENEQITIEQLEQAGQQATQTGKPIGTVLLSLGLVNEDIIKTVLELQYAVNYLNLKKVRPDLEIVSLLPWELITENEIIPISKEDNRLTLAMVNPTDNTALAKAKVHIYDLQIRRVVCSDDGFYDFVMNAVPKEAAVLSQHTKAPKEAKVAESPEQSPEIRLISVDREPVSDQNAAIIRVCNHIVSNAIARGCTNIHIEPTERQILVHYRKEGMLFPARKLPKTILPDLIERFKSMATGDSSDQTLPYDGRLSIRHDGEIFYFRLSIVPGAYGEHMVIWLE
jgi:type IV pilus assembly protein PilB